MKTLVSTLFLSFGIAFTAQAQEFKAQEFENALRDKEPDHAEQLLSVLPEGPDRLFQQARVELLRNDLKAARECYSKILENKNLAIIQTENALLASAVLAEKSQDDAELMRICKEAEIRLPHDGREIRAFRLHRARLLEKSNHWDDAQEIYSSLLGGLEEQDRDQNEAQDLYFDILKAGNKPYATETEARFGIARTLERTKQKDAAREILFNLSTSERFTKETHKKATVLYIKLLIRQDLIEKQNHIKWFDERIADTSLPESYRSKLLNLLASDYFRKKEYEKARARYMQISLFREIAKNQQAEAIEKVAECLQHLDKPAERVSQLTRLFWDRQLPPNKRTKFLKEIYTYHAEKGNDREINRILDEFSRIKNLNGNALKQVQEVRRLAEERKKQKAK